MTASQQLQTWMSYVPALVARRVAQNPTPITPPFAERFPAAVLFADITDFTTFAEQLNQRAGDRVGAEQLAVLLNTYFGRFIELVHAHGGEVVKFAGDALLTLWTTKERSGPSFGDERELALATQRAAHCALAIQKILYKYEVAPGMHLSMQMGLGAGYVSAVHLGGVFDRLEFLLSGSPLTQMSRAELLANSGQVVLAPEAWQLVKNLALGRPLSDNYIQLLAIEPCDVHTTPPLTLLPDAKPALQRYIPAAVRAYLETGHLHWQAELRQITVLFIHLPSYGTSIKHPYHRTLPKAQAVMKALQTALYRYEGSINKLNVDEKGITVMAALGVPPFAHEDDPLRGVRAAIDIQQALRHLGRPNAIGVTSGTVFCGEIGHPQRREYTMIGSPVNLSSRLMEQVTNTAVTADHLGILCDHNTYLAARNEIAFDSLPPTPIKGKPHPIPIYRPKMHQHHHYTQGTAPQYAKLVGRQQELGHLSNILHTLHHKKQPPTQNIIILEAEAGMGKTHFVAELTNRARKMKLSPLISRANPQQKYIPFKAWHTIFTTLFELTDPFNNTIEKQRTTLLRQLPTAKGERGFPALALRYAPLLNAVLPFALEENQFTKNLTSSARLEATHQFLLRLLQLMMQRRRQPIFFLFEDIQWADTASLQLMIAANQHLHPALFLVTIQKLPHHPHYQRLLAHPHHQMLTMPPLSLAETNTLLCKHLAIKTLPPHLTQLIHKESQGNPLLSQSLAQTFVEQHLLVRQNGRFHFTPPHTLPIPPTIQRLNIHTLDQLPLPHQLVLKAASVLGLTFNRYQLGTLLAGEFDDTRLGRCLDALIELDFIQRTDIPDEFRFKYRFTQQSIRNLIPQAQRQQLQNKL